MAIVDLLSRDWGVDAHRDGGKALGRVRPRHSIAVRTWQQDRLATPASTYAARVPGKMPSGDRRVCPGKSVKITGSVQSKTSPGPGGALTAKFVRTQGYRYIAAGLLERSVRQRIDGGPILSSSQLLPRTTMPVQAKLHRHRHPSRMLGCALLVLATAVSTVFATSDTTMAAGVTSTDVVADPTHFLDTFSSGRLDGWARVDQGTVDGPSNWRVSNRRLRDTSNIYGGGLARSSLSKPGTMLTFGNTAWTDSDYSVDLATGDDDAIGVVFRYQDANNYYRFSMDRQRGYRRLVAKIDGRYRLLAESRSSYVKSRWYRVRTVAVGGHLQILLNGSSVFDVHDTRLTTGKVGVYAWGSSSTTADNISVNAQTGSGFTVAVVPDTQYETQDSPAVLQRQMTWLAAVRAEQNIAMVLQEGDVVNRATSSTQWATAAATFKNLDGKVPFVVAVGNHDEFALGIDKAPYPFRPEAFNNFIGGFSDYKVDGALKAGDYRNTYRLFSADGVDLLVLNLEFGAPDNVLDWAAQVVDAHPSRHVLLLTHDYLNIDNTWRDSSNPDDRTLPYNYNPTLNDGATMWRNFVAKHPNVQFTFNGHVNAIKSPDERWSVGRLVSRNDADRPVYQTLTNFQSWAGGQGYLRLFHFDRAGRVVDVDTYSPSTGLHLTTDDNRFTFTDVDLDPWT